MDSSKIIVQENKTHNVQLPQTNAFAKTLFKAILFVSPQSLLVTDANSVALPLINDSILSGHQIVTVKHNATPVELGNTFHEHPTAIVIIPNAKQILKNKIMVKTITNAIKNNFEGRVIIITKTPMSKVPDTMKAHTYNVDLQSIK